MPKTVDYENFMVPSEFGLNWPPGTFMGMTGSRGVYGLQSIVDHSLLPNFPRKFYANDIIQVSFYPPSIPDAASAPKNLDLRVVFTIYNGLSKNCYIVFSTTATSFAFSFKGSSNPYCTVGTFGSTK